MIVADIVNAVAGKKIQDPPAFGCEKLYAGATLVGLVHLEEVEKSDPLRIHVLGIFNADGGVKWQY